ncbi:hypothetical protein AQUCO_00600183v1 [Aquilegia coerulea]|uniref:Uncharacterized protein n=1 Tax=Aquilegia coerulea TaxID=218851 RepID=A0A2G5ENX5_AQUCA|nr:hypothetical protein AQUCO_00600183v1 [Aquilegia coerulea]
METPSSMRRITRSQSKVCSINNNSTSIPLSKKSEQRTMKVDRSALFDITNDSPIVGLAMDSNTIGTPSSLIKMRNQPKKTPGSGEALLRGQVKILLQKVEEDCEIFKLSNSEKGPLLGLKGITAFSPSGILAPTPTNTPQVLNLSDINGMNGNGLGCEKISILQVKEESEIHQDEMVMEDESKLQQPSLESQKSDITRALLFDFSDFSSYSSVLSEGGVCQEKSTEEDDASVWSIQVNTSTRDEDDEQEKIEEEEVDHEDEGLVDELCDGLSKIFVQKKPLPDFEGKHTRFVYNSDGEIEREEVVHDNSLDVSSTILHLSGLPAPAGKHLRFPEEED